ncbi:MAG: O-methyltransferase [Flavobacteriales bacterium]|nr:O-methyltransferase [Flavobacteriales bacterium]
MIHDLNDDVLAYAEAHSTAEWAILKGLRRSTWQHVLTPQMLSDPIQGRFLANISRMLKPQSILELGTYTGYSTICLAAGLQPEGSIDTIEPNDELNGIQDEFWEAAGLLTAIRRHNGEALKVLPELSGPYDLVWIDADKARTEQYFEESLSRLRIGGWILVDNVLWWGKVLDDCKEQDPIAAILERLTTKLASDSRVRTTLLPLRDGILMIEKIS